MSHESEGPFDIAMEQLDDVEPQTKPCYWCGDELEPTSRYWDATTVADYEIVCWDCHIELGLKGKGTMGPRHRLDKRIRMIEEVAGYMKGKGR